MKTIVSVAVFVSLASLAWSQDPGDARSVTYLVNGKELTRTFTFQRTENGGLRLVETRGPGGQTVNTESQWARTETGATRSQVRTGPQGRQSTSETEWIMNAMGYQVVGTRTGASGQTWTRNKAVQRTGDGGYTSTGTIVGPDGRTYTLSASGQRTENGWNRQKTWTGPNGEQLVRTETLSKTANGYTRTVDKTGPKGGGSTLNANSSKTENGRQIERQRVQKERNSNSIQPASSGRSYPSTAQSNVSKGQPVTRNQTPKAPGKSTKSKAGVPKNSPKRKGN